jgi:hypothetical protein
MPEHIRYRKKATQFGQFRALYRIENLSSTGLKPWMLERANDRFFFFFSFTS